MTAAAGAERRGVPRSVSMLTFAPMIDSECTRLILSHYRIPFEEHDHIFGLASLLTFLHLGYGRIPLVYGGGLRSSGPRATVDKLDARVGDRRLLPLEPDLRTGVEESWALYNGKLAADVPLFAYFHLLPAREPMIEAFGRELRGVERKLSRASYGVVSTMLKTLLRLGPKRAADALSRIRATLDIADRAVADGRPFLHGDRLTLGDLGLVSAVQPLTLPPRYQKHVPALELLPVEFRSVVEETRQRPVARFVERVIGGITGGG